VTPTDAATIGALPAVSTALLTTGDPLAVAAWVGTMIGSAVAQYVIATRRRKRKRDADRPEN
jgi:hypothetical protein